MNNPLVTFRKSNQFATDPDAAPLIVLGMHRSGTSFAANWLKQCGFYFGPDLVGAAIGNVEGHFEDREILALHEAILHRNRCNYRLDRPVQLKFTEKHRSEAIRISLNRQQKTNWAWKEPRSCLMMELWKTVLPNYQCLVVYRDFRQVVDSLMRRKLKTVPLRKSGLERSFQRIRYQLFRQRAANRFLRVWIEYNRRILAELKTMPPESYLLVNEAKLPDCDWMLLHYMTHKWHKKQLEFVPASSVYKAEQMKRETSEYQLRLDSVDKAQLTMNELNFLEHQSFLKLLNCAELPQQSKSFKQTSTMPG